ncbi:LLM class F420-dependent oxidoreductase [Nocardia farcinica]|uniref:LLM class F420-dependent oxidoreductase n=1 Tax=Nocardia farcinica TaxID=37329 RepID=UPI001893A588|nr:LLM class F420-dependent oxidoreductase [Nocardia farcinica]MBF6260944.1 LLM class F420-dependent oxidoreductase [Nocardia farcinica]MBF6267318.1 LLM class F420-dependent oxidoreductase [Nocardia farcinica]MBF6279388.1 LLM class F420-dependent oxidoreductase [Nocardia farcinica]MBF6303954.1 LLM class F420-dependent oxidoreductase [Nocardia farcinica]MBF6388996.1 LLM class F420-dependent oxidoreductase [Nocardia farcinica]
MRIGIMLNEHAGPDSLRLLTDELRRNADEGFDSSWLTHVFGVDALTALAVAGSRVPDIAIGTAVVPTYPRHPGALAQQARTTALAVGPGRLTLGIGLSHQMVIENMYGYDFARPVRHLREYLEVLMPLVDGQPVSFSGGTVSANLQLSVPNDDRVPVLVAALGEQMLRLAGKRTDGTVLWMTGPTTIRDHIAPTITAAATEAGRPAPRIVCALPVLVTDDPDGARERAAKVFKIYGSLPSYRAMMDREGAAGPADLAIVGTEDQVAERVRTVFAAGATEFVGIVFADGDDATRTRKLLTDLKS